MKLAFALFATVLLLGSGRLHAADFVLVQDSQPQAEIILAENAPRMTKLATEDLQAYVAKMSGAKLGIANKPSGGRLLPVFVGRSAHTDALKLTDAGLAHGAFRIVATDRALVLLGHDADFTPPEPHARHNGDIPRATAEWDKLTGAKWGFPHVQLYKSQHGKLKLWEQDERGSFNAVCELLRRLGVRWFMPGEIGEVVPKLATIRIPVGDETVRPGFALRYPYQYFKRFSMTSVDELMWQLRLGLSEAPEVIGLGDLGHGINPVHERPEMRDAHPEWYVLSGRKRETAGSFGAGKPCLSSPGLFAENVRFVRAMFDIYKEPMVSVMPEDGYVALCQCELCKGKGTPERGWNGQISDYVWDYVNRVGLELMKTHPDKKILCFAYGAYQAPPAKIARLSPNIVVGITQARSAFYEPTERKVHEELRAAWRTRTTQPLLIWDYYLGSRPGHVYESLPMFFTRQVAEDLKSLKGISLGDFIEVQREWEGLKSLAANHLNLYVNSRYWWNADQPLEPLLEDYCAKFYGPAAAEMRAFIAFSEANWMHMRKQPDKIDAAFALLAKAQAKVPTDSGFAKRIGIIADYIAPMKQLREQLTHKRENVPHIQLLPNEGKPIVVDGQLDEAVWQRPGGWGFAELETGRTPYLGTTFKAAWQGDSLILAITCRERDPARLASALKEQDSGAIWDGDVVELLIETQVHSYYQIAINPAGAVTDLDRAGGKLNTLWKAGLQVATSRDSNSWTIELRLPVADEQQAVLNPLNGVAGRPPSLTYPWHFNLCRQRIGEHGVELSALSPTGANNFHVTERFAMLNMKLGGTNQGNPSLNPQRRTGYVLQRADALDVVKQGKHAEALAAFHQLATNKPTDLQQADALAQAIECALRLKQPAEALALAQQIRLPHHAKLARMRVLDANRQWGDLTTQFAHEDLAQWPDPLVAEAAALRGHAWLMVKDGPKAERDLQQAVAWTTEDNQKGECLLNLGSTCRQLLKDDAKAIAAYRRVYATRNEFKHCTAAVAVAGILSSQGKPAEAQAELARIDERQMTIPYYREMLGKAKSALAAGGK